jgi:hypothetical protein
LRGAASPLLAVVLPFPPAEMPPPAAESLSPDDGDADEEHRAVAIRTNTVKSGVMEAAER